MLLLDGIIATRHRPEPLRNCLLSIDAQSVLPGQIVIVDSSLDSRTGDLVESLRGKLRFPVTYRHTDVVSAAGQRNIGVSLSTAPLVAFLDDDVVLETDFIEEIVHVFEADVHQRVGGVSGTITNQVYSNPRGLNRLLLGLCVGSFRGSYAGRLVGPAVNFLPEDLPDTVQEVQWLPSTCTAYRRDVFLEERFSDEFQGYSFAEDVHLSSRVAKRARLLNTTRARVFHEDLGKFTHRDWRALGESMVVNRHQIMASVLERKGILDNLQLFAYEVVYAPVAYLAGGITRDKLQVALHMVQGKLRGFSRIWFHPAQA